MRRNARHRRGNNTGYSAALHSLTLQSVCFTSYASHAIVSPIPVKVLFLKILIFADTRDVFQIVWSKRGQKLMLTRCILTIIQILLRCNFSELGIFDTIKIWKFILYIFGEGRRTALAFVPRICASFLPQRPHWFVRYDRLFRADAPEVR